MVVRLLLFCIFYSAGFVFAQNPEVSGRVTDATSGEPLVGVNVFYSNLQGVATDASGFYAISVSPGKVILQFRFIGYNAVQKELSQNQGQKLTLNIAMEVSASLLNEVVVSASRYEEKISDVIVSMEVLSSATVENTHTVSIETALQQVSGVMFLDDQVSIRSGNGYSYGVGSRVLLLLDDLPMLTGGGGTQKWEAVALCNLNDT